jgi:hypothetical protein
MEDAMIINKSSFQRGFGHASVYKVIKVDCADGAMRGGGGAGERGSERLTNLIPRKSPEYGKALGRMRREAEEAAEQGLPAPYSGPPLFNPKVSRRSDRSFLLARSLSQPLLRPATSWQRQGMMRQNLWFDYPKYAVEIL